MIKPTIKKNNMRIILALLFVVGGTTFALAQDQDANAVANRGFATYRDIPENKKGTVIVDSRISSPNNPSKATDPNLTLKEEQNLTELQKQARLYRTQGMQFQNLGKLDSALSFYQKAIQLDPAYAAAYNDLGVIYEAMGHDDRAEQSYLQALRINPNFLSAYSNLALFYENKRDLKQAAANWKKRVELGMPDDPWTQKAKQRYLDICSVISKRPIQDMREQEIVELLNDVTIEKELLKKDNIALARDKLIKAKRNYKKGDEVLALKLAIDAEQLDPDNDDIEAFIDKVQTRLLSK